MVDLAGLITEIDQLDIRILRNSPFDFETFSDVVDKEIV